MRLVPLALALALAGCLAPLQDPAGPDGGDGAGGGAPADGAEAGAWPRAGSFAEYEVRTSSGSPDLRFDRIVHVRLDHDGTRWTGTCRGTYQEIVYDPERRVAVETPVEETVRFAPPAGPREPARGEAVDVGILAACEKREAEGVVEGQSEATSPAGARSAWRAVEPEETAPYRDTELVWDVERGLVLEFRDWGRNAGSEGRLLATDAFG